MKSSYRCLKKRVVFSKGPIHLVDWKVKLPNGKVIHRQVCEHPGSVVIVPRLAKDKYIMLRQYRFAISKAIWEFPAGGLESGEPIRLAASRELMEEAGYKPRKLTKLFSFYPTPGVSSELMHLFLAEDLVPFKMIGDEDESMTTHVMNSAKILKLIQNGSIVDAKTIAGFLYLRQNGL